MLHASETEHGLSRWVRWLALALTGATFGLVACGGNGADETASPKTTGVDGGRSTDPGTSGKKLLIKTHVVIDIPDGGPQPGKPISTGEVLGGSSLGGAPFCARGTFTDLHSDDPAIGLVDRTFNCSDGTLRIGFTPGAPQGRTQSGPWHLISGTGDFQGAGGKGEIKIVYEPGTQATEGHESFTGTVSP